MHSRHCLPALGLALALIPARGLRAEPVSEEESFQSSCAGAMAAPDKIAAAKACERFLEEHPSGPRSNDARFLAGEAYLGYALSMMEIKGKGAGAYKKEAARNAVVNVAFGQAREAFENVAQRSHKGALAASARHRMGEIAYAQGHWREAAAEFGRAASGFPDGYLLPESLLAAAAAELAQGNLGSAQAALLALAQRFPARSARPDAVYVSGLASLYNREFDRAVEVLSRVKTAEAAYSLGKAHLLALRPYQAAAAWERLLEEHPASSLREQAEFDIADAYLRAKDYGGALEKYRKFRSGRPASELAPAALYREAGTLLKLGEHGKARAAFQGFLDRYPEHALAPPALYLAGAAHLAAGQAREAAGVLSVAASKYPDDPRVAARAGYKLALALDAAGDSKEAARACREFLARHPGHALTADVYFLMGSVLGKTGDVEAAVASFQRLIDLAPASPLAEQALFSILKIKAEAGDHLFILSYYPFALRQAPASVSLWRGLCDLYFAEALLAAERGDEAQDAFESILKLHSSDLPAYHALEGLMWLHSVKGEDAKAAAYGDKLKDLSARSDFKPRAGAALAMELAMAENLYRRKNYEAAQGIFERFATDNPDAPEAPSALHKAAQCLYHLRYYSQAVETWRLVESRYPVSQEAGQAAFLAADTLFRAQKYAEASAAYKSISERRPGDPRLPLAYLRLAQASFNAGRDSETVEQSREVLGRFPDQPEASDALDLLEAALDRSPSLDFEAVLRSVLAKTREPQRLGDLRLSLGRRLLEKKAYREASEEFRRFSLENAAHPGLAKAQFYLGEANFQQGLFEESSRIYERLLDNFGASEDAELALFRLATCRYNLTDHASAAKRFAQFLDSHPDSAYAGPARFNLGLAYRSVGKLDQAEEALSRYAREARADDAVARGALWQLFEIRQDRRDFPGSLKTLEELRARLKDGDEPWAETLYREGEVRAAMDDAAGAVQAWERLRLTQPAGNPFRLQGLLRLGERYSGAQQAALAAAVYDDLAVSAPDPKMARAAAENASALKKTFASLNPAAKEAP